MTTEAVYKFLESRHRPFNVNDIASNLPEGTKKPAIQQSLDKLVKAGKVLEKVNLKKHLVFIYLLSDN